MNTLKILLSLIILFSCFQAVSQNTFRAYILDEHTREPLVGAVALRAGYEDFPFSDTTGLITIENIRDGEHTFVVSYLNYQSHSITLIFPLSSNEPLIIYLEEAFEVEEVTISTTRSSRTIENIPTRIEFLGPEELGEKAVMNSANIAMLLRESTGIQMQQTSPNSANQSIRIQGLDGRYTQILKDGIPLFGGFAGGLSIMQIPPLDLKQVEVIKGSASTLYGGGAIAGLVNLVTKKPIEGSPELSLMLNQTSANGTTANGFYAQKFDKMSLSLYASGNRQNPFDPNEDGFSDIPKVRSLTLTPRIFWYPDDSTTCWFGINTTLEDRVGGDIAVIENGPDASHVFTEQNLSQRFSSQLAFDKTFQNAAQLRIRNGIGYFDREINIPEYQFSGSQIASFSEATYSLEKPETSWIFGANLFTDQFRENQTDTAQLRDYRNTTLGGFVQNTWDISPVLALESGLRTDYNTSFGPFLLPRFSLLFKLSRELTGRLGGGMGYKLPTIFTEDSEALTFRNILPINQDVTDAEKSVGGNFDINYQTLIRSKWTFSINQYFFYTRLNDALVLSQNPATQTYFFSNADGPVETKGFESNLKFTYGYFKLFLQYAFTDVRLNYKNVNNQKPLTPRHSAGAVLVYEQHEKWRIGLESYYTGRQYLSDYSRTRDFWIVGFMAMRQFKHVSLFLNFENFVDTRQSKFQDIVIPPFTNPTFAEIWAPMDGFVVNGGFIFKLFAEEEDHHH